MTNHLVLLQQIQPAEDIAPVVNDVLAAQRRKPSGPGVAGIMSCIRVPPQAPTDSPESPKQHMPRLMKDEVDAVQKAKHSGIRSDDGAVNGRPATAAALMRLTPVTGFAPTCYGHEQLLRSSDRAARRSWLSRTADMPVVRPGGSLGRAGSAVKELHNCRLGTEHAEAPGPMALGSRCGWTEHHCPGVRTGTSSQSDPRD